MEKNDSNETTNNGIPVLGANDNTGTPANENPAPNPLMDSPTPPAETQPAPTPAAPEPVAAEPVAPAPVPEASASQPSTPAQELPDAPATNSSAPAKKKTGLIVGLIIGLVALIGIGIGLCIVFIGNSNNDPKPENDSSSSNTSTIDPNQDPTSPEVRDPEALDEFKKAQETIEKTKDSTDAKDLEANIEARITQIEYYFNQGDLQSIGGLLDELEQTANELKTISGGEYDTTDVEALISSIRKLSSALENSELVEEEQEEQEEQEEETSQEEDIPQEAE